MLIITVRGCVWQSAAVSCWHAPRDNVAAARTKITDKDIGERLRRSRYESPLEAVLHLSFDLLPTALRYHIMFLFHPAFTLTGTVPDTGVSP